MMANPTEIDDPRERIEPRPTVVTRFAPSPTGDLHLGHAYSAWFARDIARRAGGRFLVRIEDIDAGRCRAEFIDRNLDDLDWLGLNWDGPVWRQSARLDHYRQALDRLGSLGVTYPCFCTRKDIQREIAAAAGAPHSAPDGSVIYPGTCRSLDPDEAADRIAAGQPYALRLDVGRVRQIVGELTWTDRALGTCAADPERFGDVVIARKDLRTSYHLAVVVDDVAQGVTEVTRGEDLLDATHVHRALYALLASPVPTWHHHGLCRDADGRRLAKRRDGQTIRALRAEGWTPDAVLERAIANAHGTSV